jgi:hypothetical protein
MNKIFFISLFFINYNINASQHILCRSVSGHSQNQLTTRMTDEKFKELCAAMTGANGRVLLLNPEERTQILDRAIDRAEEQQAQKRHRSVTK